MACSPAYFTRVFISNQTNSGEENDVKAMMHDTNSIEQGHDVERDVYVKVPDQYYPKEKQTSLNTDDHNIDEHKYDGVEPVTTQVYDGFDFQPSVASEWDPEMESYTMKCVINQASESRAHTMEIEMSTTSIKRET
eukprot:TRINITY_DN12120_c0_g1_i1.p1 TRINITY_DN12120_c0_g1~~TRINITY_DN12120_c0_g1_i1.p1  ORF type:complete len:136 (-),score=11.35 TRINITY_DN12120_c0_g1_i1:162-569(-)